VASLNARLQQAKASAELSSIDLARQEQLLKNDAISQSDYDRARLTDQGNRDGVAQLNADLETARLASRPDIVAAAEAAVQAAQAAEEKAEWAVTQKEQHAPADALVFDTIYRAGEFVGAGLPVVELLPPENLKVRFFVSEAQASRMKVGAHVAVHVTGTDQPLDGTVSYLSPQAEYTPPVLYNRDNREKLVYMAEAVFAPALARDLHPGQPVDVNLPP
jgi:HlyD family secretion protein